MKFFTHEWARGEMTDEEAERAMPAYWRYVEGLDLPRSIGELAILEPHDAYILEVEHEEMAKTLHLCLRCGDLQRGYFDASLGFSDVTIRPEDLARLAKARRPAEFDVLYDEVDRVGADRFEYRLLLCPDGEVALQFRDVVITRRSHME